MKDRSAVANSAGSPISASSRWRRFVRSRTRTRGSSRRVQASCPRPTSTATTSAAPRCRRQSVKPPVDAPASRQRRPATGTANCSIAASSFSPPRETNRGRGPAHHDRLAAVDHPGRRSRRGAADRHVPGRDRLDGHPPTGDEPTPDELGVEPTPHRATRPISGTSSRPSPTSWSSSVLLGRLLRGLLGASGAFFGRSRGLLRLLLPAGGADEPGLEAGEVVLRRDAHRLHLTLDLAPHDVEHLVGPLPALVDEIVDEALHLVLGELTLGDQLLRPPAACGA